MEKLNAILVDDEEAARNVLAQLLTRNCPSVRILDTCVDVPSAVESIRKFSPDVVFLDVQMPNYAGYELVNFFDQIDFEIVFVTAYDHYAIKAFELSAVDYLVKPINRQRLIDAVEKLSVRITEKNAIRDYHLLKDSLQTKKIEHLVIPELGNHRIVKLDEIIAIEANGAYSTIHLECEKKITVSKNLKHFESILPEEGSFFRTHKSWIINLKKVEQYAKSDLEILLKRGIIAKLSKYKKASFEERF